MPSIPMLKVYANPFTHIDASGQPAGVLLYEPDPLRGDAAMRWVGACCVATKTRAADPKNGVREAWDHAFEYATEPTIVPRTAYYMRALEHRDLIAADPHTHAVASGSQMGFKDPRAVLGQLAEEHDATPLLQGSGDRDERDADTEWAAFIGNKVEG